jgi:two-component system, LytTR family, sensor kinase
MQHPLFKNIRLFLVYLAVWLLISGIQFAILFFYYQVDPIAAIIDSVVFNLLFALLGISIWFIIRFSRSSKNNILNEILNQLGSALIILLLWIGISVLFLRAVFDGNSNYIDFLLHSFLWRFGTGIFFYTIIYLVYQVFIYYDNLQEKLLTENRMKEMVKQAELDLLKSQINPHFLFNSLNSISSLTISDPGKAQEMIVKLSDFLRYSVSQNIHQLTTLRQEMENIRLYLDIEKVRFGNKLVYEYEFDEDCSRMTIPVMILQPLYENAVKHGVYESTETIFIKTVCELKDNVLHLTITNNFDPAAKSRKGTGMGLKHIRERLKLIYQNDQLIKTLITGNTFEVKLFIPQNEGWPHSISPNGEKTRQ